MVIRLLGSICFKARMDPDHFVLLNQKSMREEDFDALNMSRRDLGSLLRTICKCCGASVLGFLNQRLSECYQSV